MTVVYYCWITGMMPSYQDGIVAGLVRKGYMVGATSRDGNVTFINGEDEPATVFAIMVYRHSEANCEKVYEDVNLILNEMKALCYSIIVSPGFSEAIWMGPNFKLPPKEYEIVIDVVEEEPPKPPPNRNLN